MITDKKSLSEMITDKIFKMSKIENLFFRNYNIVKPNNKMSLQSTNMSFTLILMLATVSSTIATNFLGTTQQPDFYNGDDIFICASLDDFETELLLNCAHKSHKFFTGNPTLLGFSAVNPNQTWLKMNVDVSHDLLNITYIFDQEEYENRDKTVEYIIASSGFCILGFVIYLCSNFDGLVFFSFLNFISFFGFLFL